jgi:hypothetical protein
MKRNLSLLLLSLFAFITQAQIAVNHKTSNGAFTLFANGKVPTIVVAPTEEISVKTVANLFAQDVQRVTGTLPIVRIADSAKDNNLVIIGTQGKNKLIEQLIKKHKIDITPISNGWEQYIIKIINKPCKGVDKALVIVGSDKRGAAYGTLSISEAIGVSPYYWWADVPVEHHTELYIAGEATSKSPSVRYRGLFINDEDWGMKPWSATNYEKELGDIGPKTYIKVCELILRLKGNMLAPAMHARTGAFYSHPESKVVADSFGIVISTSHCEPLLINTAAVSEFDIKRDGDWNYATNDSTIRRKWDNRLSEASCYENIYTLAMRGLHDSGLRGNLPMDEQVALLTRVIKDQRSLLLNHIPKAITDIPQIFVPYKETMGVYENGLQIPDDVTLVWVDDNYGYMKRVSDPQERQRSGRSGVYYHISYLGKPHDYLWINTTAPTLMYEELMKSYNTSADRYWLLNVGDIKPMELGLKTFFDLAWNVDDFNFGNINRHQANFLGNTFGREDISKYQDILDTYYKLAWSRKPEFMGWEREWDDKKHSGLKDTEFSFSNYSEAQKRLADYKKISDDVNAMLHKLPAEKYASFFELIAYPVMASYQMNRKFLMAQLNHELYAEGKTAEANWAATQMEQAFDSIASLNNEYNSLLGGKWNGMMTVPPGWCALYQNKPEVTYTEGIDEQSVNLDVIPFDLDRCHIVDLCNIGDKYESNGHKFSIIEGMGYDWKVLQLGTPTDSVANASDITGDRVVYTLPHIDCDSVEVIMYTVPFFPLHQGRNTDIGIAIDNCTPKVFRNKFKEYGLSWKNQVLRNGAEVRLTFAIDKMKDTHKLSLICGDPGMMVEKIILNWGGVKKSYLGPYKE